jgi:uroporphyrinogen-III decarboxylase
MLKPLITEPSDLEALRFLLQPPAEQDIAAYRRESGATHRFAAQHGVLLAGGWGVALDMANWLCGMQELMMLAVDKPVFVDTLLGMIHAWNVRRMEVVLAGPVDLYIRRAWYEGCDFITPRFYRTHILPRLRVEVALAHDHGARFGYICSSGTVPMLDFYAEAGIDVLIGVDPIQGTYTDMPRMKQRLGQEVALWGGVSAAITVEQGSEQDVREAVRLALHTLGPRGFILSPVDNLTVDAPRTWQNLAILIDEWQRQR